MTYRRYKVGIVVVVCLAFVLLGAPPVHAASTLVQQNNAGNCAHSGCTGSSVQVSLQNVASGDVLVVAVNWFYAFQNLTSLTDSLGSSFTQAVYISGWVGCAIGAPTSPCLFAAIFYATLSSGASSDTLTATFSRPTGGQNVYVYEISGVTTAGAATGTGAAPDATRGTTFSTVPVSFQSGAFLLAIVSSDTIGCTPSYTTPTPGFTTSTENSGALSSCTEWSDTLSSSPTTFTMTYSGLGINWVEASIALNPSVISGFPIEGIIIGSILGVALVTLLRRKRRVTEET